MTQLTHYIGASGLITFPLTVDGAAVTPDANWGFVFSAKRDHLRNRDAAALFQKASGAGFDTSGSDGEVTLVREDTKDLSPVNLWCGVLGTHAITGETMVCDPFRLQLARGVTRETVSTLDIITTEPPVPFAGSVSLASVLTLLGVPSYANLTAANAALAIGKIYYDTTLATLNVTTA